MIEDRGGKDVGLANPTKENESAAQNKLRELIAQQKKAEKKRLNK